MSVRELIPTMQGLRDAAAKLSIRVADACSDESVRAARRTFDLGDVANQLASLAGELDGQINTANRPYTVAVVGEFKVGKSTFLNSLLGLTGDAELSAKDEPDTACSIILSGRQEGDPEARLHFIDGAREDTSWHRASGFTSQVWRNEHPEDRITAEKLLHVEYFIRNALLASICINDLPGTGSRYWKEHTDLTHQKMKEADAIIWVVGEREPSADGRKNLEVLAGCAQKVIPVVNVFEDPTATPPLLREDHTVENVVDRLNREYAGWFHSDFLNPICISSKVILLESTKVDPDPDVLERAGHANLRRLIDHLTETMTSGQHSARQRRVAGAGISIGNKLGQQASALISSIDKWMPQFEGEQVQAQRRFDEIRSVHFEVRSRIKLLARDRATKICRYISDAGQLFVQDTLQLSNVEDITTALKRDGRKVLEKKLEDRFQKEYLRLDVKPNWLEELSLDYAHEVALLHKWQRIE